MAAAADELLALGEEPDYADVGFAIALTNDPSYWRVATAKMWRTPLFDWVRGALSPERLPLGGARVRARCADARRPLHSPADMN
jgi:hypothetical protein